MARLSARRDSELLRVRSRLRHHVINRSRTIRTISETVHHNEIKLGSPGGPVNSFVFLNPANINGARLYGTLTTTVFNSRGTVVELSVSRCVRGRAISHLVNSPPKCINCSRNNRLARGMEEGPCSIMLFSRVRGTRPSIFGVLLRVLSSNILASNRNEHISFGGYVVVVASGINTGLVSRGRGTFNFTTNTGRLRRGRGRVGSTMVNRLHGAFHPRFLGEMSSVVMFRHLAGRGVGRVTSELLTILRGHIRSVNVRIAFSSRTIDGVTSTNFSSMCNTEPLGHTVRDEVRSTLSRRVLGNGIGGNNGCVYGIGSSGFIFSGTRRGAMARWT